jgi:hypothetical protein
MRSRTNATAPATKSFLVLSFKKEQKRKRFFFEKKKQKTFFNLASVYGIIHPLVLGVRWIGSAFVCLGVLRVLVVEI